MNKKLIKIISVMHPFPFTIGVNQTLAIAISMMKEHNVRHLPVKENNQLIGILSERDINFALRVEKKTPKELKVLDVYVGEPYTVDPETLVSVVAAKMAHEHIGCTLVVKDEKLVGIFTTVDACRLLSELLSDQIEQ